MSMAPTWAALRAMTDDELVAVYDRLSRNTMMGTGFYVEEIRRREQVRANEAAHRLAQESHRTAQASVALSVERF